MLVLFVGCCSSSYPLVYSYSTHSSCGSFSVSVSLDPRKSASTANTFQYHVASCASLRFRIVEEFPVASLELEAVTYLPGAVVEHAITLIMEQTLYAPALAISMLAHIESSIQESLELVFSLQTLSFFFFRVFHLCGFYF